MSRKEDRKKRREVRAKYEQNERLAKEKREEEQKRQESMKVAVITGEEGVGHTRVVGRRPVSELKVEQLQKRTTPIEVQAASLKVVKPFLRPPPRPVVKSVGPREVQSQLSEADLQRIRETEKRTLNVLAQNRQKEHERRMKEAQSHEVEVFLDRWSRTRRRITELFMRISDFLKKEKDAFMQHLSHPGL